MSGEDGKPSRQFVKIGVVRHLGESAIEGEDISTSQLLYWRLSSKEVDRMINAIDPTLAKQLETLIKSVGVLSERSSNRSTEENVISERSRSAGQHFETGAFRLTGISRRYRCVYSLTLVCRRY